MRELAPAWHEALNAGKATLQLDLKAEPERGRALCAEADVVLESFRPGVVERLGIGPSQLPGRVVYCSFTGFGPEDLTAGHDLNYQGWAGLLDDTAPALPPVQVADLGAALRAVAEVLAALLARGRTGRGAHVVVSLTHGAHELAAHRLGGEPFPRLLTGGLACYRIYATADGRHLTVAALEPSFFRRLCELVGRPELAERQWDAEQEPLAAELAEAFAAHPLAAWLELFEGEDVAVGPVATLEEAAAQLGGSPSAAGSASRSGSRSGTSG
jgi:crotonobetainyl-CoA:carnitine CoA-transferase CaiB-like acyl-CoA transferase